MAKWDLSKLPEGRAPLPDEWFREKVHMQDRIEELEAKLSKAVRLISEKPILATYEDDVQWQKYVIAELTGGKDA